MEWTSQQQNAIDARNCSVIVSAAAGSGKTAVLTERLVQLLADPDSGVRADRIVVVTFTNDAASELKKRLGSKLRELINNDPGNIHLIKQQVLLQSAHISTINSFCFELLRDHTSDQGITSGFSVLDEADESVLRAAAMEDTLNYCTENYYDDISYLYDRFCIRGTASLKAVINSIDKFLASAALREKWLNDAADEYEKDFLKSVYFRSLCDSCLKKLRKAYKLAEEKLDSVPDIFDDLELPQVKKFLDQAHEDKDRVFELMRIFENDCFPDSDQINNALNFGSRKSVKKDIPRNIALWDLYDEKRKLIVKTVKEIAGSISSAESSFSESAEITGILVRFVRIFQDNVWKRKCEKNAISFDDGERLALELLISYDENGNIIQSDTAKSVSQTIDLIMIDEYQDSNNKQDMLFKLLSKNYKQDSSGQPMYGDNVFLVGDVKQSIYGFRLANPKNFIATLRNSVRYDPDSAEPNQFIFLNKNFRSYPEVIDFINNFFSAVMSEKCGDIEYNADEMLYLGAPEYSPDPSRKTHFAFICEDPSDDNEADDHIVKTSDDKVDSEAVYTAAKIADMLKSGFPVALKDGKTRPCQPSDFCILVRKNYLMKAYVKQLQALGIPVKGSDEKGYLRSREITILLDLLRIISNPLLDVPLTAVMVSPMYMFTIQEIAYIRSFNKELPMFSLLRQAADSELPEFSDESLAARIKSFLDALDSFRLDSVTMSLGELITSIYDTTDFISVMQLYSEGEKKRANLRALIQYAQNYESASAYEGSGGLSGFLRHIDRIMETNDFPQGKVSASSGSYVTIQTLHGSKGLEYPFVFIAETSSRFKFDSDTVMCSDDSRIGYILYDHKLVRKYRTFQHSVLLSEAESSTRSEEMRLLYVGMTRAKQQLFINLKCGEKSLAHTADIIEKIVINGSDEDVILSAGSVSDWLWCWLARHCTFPEIADAVNLNTEQFGLPEPEISDDVFSYEVFTGISQKADDLVQQNDLVQPDDSIVKRINDIIGFNYDTTLSRLPANLSVTQIAKKSSSEKAFDLQLQRPKFMAEGGTLTGAEKGTAIHTFFQYCDFSKAQSDPSAEILRIADSGYITPSQADSISIKNVQAFFKSPLYKRICTAKKYWREKKFIAAASDLDYDEPEFLKIKDSDGMIKGIVDLLIEEEDGLVIVDYKSDRHITKAALRERYTPQIMIYKAAMELSTGKKVKEALLYSFELRDTVDIPLWKQLNFF